MPTDLETRLTFLRSHGADARSHSGGDLLHHLMGTREILVGWGASAELADAGLFHSVYGTESFQRVTIPPALRPEVRALIGETAETIAWNFGIQDRRAFLTPEGEGLAIVHRQTGERTPISRAQRTEQIVLHLANALEQLPRLGREVPASYWTKFQDPDLLLGAKAALAPLLSEGWIV